MIAFRSTNRRAHCIILLFNTYFTVIASVCVCVWVCACGSVGVWVLRVYSPPDDVITRTMFIGDRVYRLNVIFIFFFVFRLDSRPFWNSCLVRLVVFYPPSLPSRRRLIENDRPPTGFGSDRRFSERGKTQLSLYISFLRLSWRLSMD